MIIINDAKLKDMMGFLVSLNDEVRWKERILNALVVVAFHDHHIFN